MMILVGIILAFAVQAPPAEGRRVPIIATGWDSPTPKQFREGLEVFERWAVFEGTTLMPTRRTPKGDDVDARNAFSREHWTWEDFAGALADLKAASPKTCRENYLMLYANPGDVDWFDDAGWKEIVDHWRLLARLARQSGMRGILYDAEPYIKPYSQFLYRAQAGRDAHTFAEYGVQARRRGREVMEAVRAEFPDIVIFTFRLFSDMLGLLGSGDLARALESDTYGLQPSFVNGWLDVMAPEAKVIEGAEDIGYRANSAADYDASFTRLRTRMPDFVAPEHREKVNRQFRVGQSLYLDAYINPVGHPWHIPRAGTTAAARLTANVTSALRASDGVVWLYGEQARWWPGGGAKAAMWPDKLAGAVEAIRQAADPVGFAREQFRSRPPGDNLLANGDFAKVGAPTLPPEGWWTWQDEGSHGKLVSAPGWVDFSAMQHGVLGQIISVKPQRTYAVHLRVKAEGRGVASLQVAWKSATDQWTAHTRGARFVPSGPPDKDGWQDLYGLVEVPAEASKLVFLPAAVGQVGAVDRCSFSGAGLMEIPE